MRSLQRLYVAGLWFVSMKCSLSIGRIVHKFCEGLPAILLPIPSGGQLGP